MTTLNSPLNPMNELVYPTSFKDFIIRQGHLPAHQVKPLLSMVNLNMLKNILQPLFYLLNNMVNLL